MVLMIRASKSSPTRSLHELTFFHSTSSRSASAARRSVCEQSSAIGVRSSSLSVGPCRSSMLAQQAMHDQVGIAADGRREMRVAVGAASAKWPTFRSL